MQEKQPILRAFVESGYAGKMISVVINEKKELGVATIHMESTDEMVTLYWNKEKKQWQDKMPAYIHPNLVAKHYASAI
jgi:hypothetical protein